MQNRFLRVLKYASKRRVERGGQKAAPFTLLNVLSTGLFESECNADSDLEIVAPFVVQRKRVPFLERHVVKLE